MGPPTFRRRRAAAAPGRGEAVALPGALFLALLRDFVALRTGDNTLAENPGNPGIAPAAAAANPAKPAKAASAATSSASRRCWSSASASASCALRSRAVAPRSSC